MSLSLSPYGRFPIASEEISMSNCEWSLSPASTPTSSSGMGGGIHNCESPPGIGCCREDPRTGADDLSGRPLPIAGNGMPPGCPVPSLPSFNGLPRPIPLPLELPSKSSSGSHKFVSDAIVSCPSSRPGGKTRPAASASSGGASSDEKSTGTGVGAPSSGNAPCGGATSTGKSPTPVVPARPCKLELERTCGKVAPTAGTAEEVSLQTSGIFPTALSALAAALPMRRRARCRALLAALPVRGAASKSTSTSSSDSSASPAEPSGASALSPATSPSCTAS
mmetsp:Transcript_1327/g.3563  ORF Transcript_1327/g.3563 Transcript_1327/m.3563 type:complete len:279 (-) Transcript_1327:545-1381(-)